MRSLLMSLTFTATNQNQTGRRKRRGEARN